MLPAVKWCVLHEDFQGDHKEFIGDLQPHLQAIISYHITQAIKEVMI